MKQSLATETLNYDVVVVGGGPAGIAAALESARSGAKTAVIERYGALGGNMTLGCVGPLMGAVSSGSIAWEIQGEINEAIDIERAKYVFVKKLAEAGVDVYLQTLLFDVVTQDGSIKSVLTAGKSGRLSFSAKLYVDATGDGDLAAYAGCQYEYGREADGLLQPVSLMFIIGGVDPEQKLVCQHEEHHTLLSNGKDYLQMCKDACASGELPATVNIVRLYHRKNPTERMVNATQANGINPLSAADLYRAELDLRTQTEIILQFLKSKVPGFENSRIIQGAGTMGVRESRRIIGDYILQDKDIISGRKFPDVAVHNALFSIDIHNPSGAGQSETDGRPHRAQPYDIPFSCMRPLGINNLYTAGRCISGTHRSHASYRVMRICMAMGQAAGAAAAMAAAKGCGTRELNTSDVQKHLMDRGVKLFD